MASATDSVLVATGCDNEIRWRAGERLEHLFEERCDRLRPDGRADALAVDGPDGALTYAELDVRANQLARFLKRQGILPGQRVGLLFDHRVSGYVAMIAVLKLHAAYVPLDPAFPAERIASIAADAEIGVLLSESHVAEGLAALERQLTVFCLDEVEIAIAGERADRLDAGEVPEPVDELCYVIYTSGTSGRPKGVAVSHASIVNFVRVAAEVYGMRPDDRVYQGLTIAFDFSVEEIWVAWMAGATLVPKPTGQALLGDELHRFLTEQRVTALCCVPTLLATIDHDLPELRFLLVSGESCPADLVKRWHRPGRRFLNVYGPTEATVSATWTELHPSRPVTIGVPLPTYSTVVLDPDADRVLAADEFGELGIAGIGLADGYLNRPDLDRRAFIDDFVPMPANPSERIYRTGDLVRVNEDGEIEHHGRIDSQVKIRGYRIEVEEVEAVMRELPEIDQVIVHAWESAPGVTELVAYYTSHDVVDPAQAYSHLAQRLPSYMVPAYLEPLERLPIMPSGKADRKRLPAPRGSRRLAAAEHYVPPASELEAAVAAELAAVLGVDRVSVEAHFFDELGANSLLMARFAARLRDAAIDLPAPSIRNLYGHPTVRSLAAALSDQPAEPAARWTEPSLPPPTGTPRYLLCGLLQLLAVLATTCLAAQLLDKGSRWVFAAHGAIALYARGVVFGSGLMVAMALLPVAAKWLLVGRFKPQRIRVWSLEYVRFWIVKTLMIANPVAHLLVGSPLYGLYLRAFGARVSSGALIFSQHIPVCADLLAIGPDSVVLKDVYMNCYRARAGLIEIGPVSLGSHTFVGERSVLDIHTELGHDAQLGHSSALHAGQAAPAGECWHGSPAQPAPVEYDYRALPERAASPLRRIGYGAGRVLALLALAGPLEALLAGSLLTHPRWIDHLGPAGAALIAACVLFGALIAGLVAALTIPRLLTRALEPGKVYPLYGLHYRLQRIIARVSNNPTLTGLFGDSCAIVHYLRALGYRLGVVEQTGSNFGMAVRQEIPALSMVGTGTMVSDGLSIMNAEFSSTSFRVLPVAVGRRNYVGNAISYPAASRAGDNCLLATKAMIPVAGPVRDNVGLLGSPPFEIPRSVLRDKRFDELAHGTERQRRLAAKTRHNVVTMCLHLLVSYLFLLGLLVIASGPFGGRGAAHLAGTAGSTVLELALMLALFVLAERAVTGFRMLEPRCCSIYHIDFWRHERLWKVAPTAYMRLFDGTPFKAWVWRALGVRIGRRVFDDGLSIIERTLVSIGDESTFSMGSSLQAHTLEDGAFKSDRIVIGSSCTVGTGALVNYGASMGDGSELGPDSFLMKGSRVDPGTRWHGNPASEVSRAREPQLVRSERN